jgi:hypothetical protein
MRWVILFGVLAVFGLVGSQVIAWRGVAREVSRVTERLGGLAELSTAAAFSERLSRELADEGLLATGPITVTMSASAPSGESEVRSVSVRVEGVRRLVFGLFAPRVVAEVKVRGVLPAGSRTVGSHFPADRPRLVMAPLGPGLSPPVIPDEVVEAADTAWSVATRDERRVVSSIAVSRGCELRCETKAGARLWTDIGPCRLMTWHRKFVSDDCERVVGFDPRSFPARWQTHPVAVVTDRAQLAWEVGALTVVRDVNQVRNNHGWLQGLSDVPGDGPTYRDDGQAVVFVTVEGQRHEVPLVKTTASP